MPGESTVNTAVRTFDAIVLGAGPGGAATSLFLHDASLAGESGRSLTSLLVDTRAAAATRKNVVLLQPELVDGLRAVGVLDEVLPAASDAFVGAASGRTFGVASLARIENALRGKVAAVGAGNGIETAYESTIEGVRRLPDHSIEAQLVHHDGSRETVRAAALVDATGGRSGLLAQGPESSPRWFLTGHADYQPELPAYQRIQLKDAHTNAITDTWALGFNHSEDGMSAFVQIPDEAAAGATTDQQTQTLARYLNTAEMPVTGTPHAGANGQAKPALEDVYVVRSTTSLVPNAAEDGVYAIGNSVGNGSPVYGDGVKLAIDDARTAATAIRSVVDTGLPTDAPTAAVAQVRASIEAMYDQMVRFNHRASTVQPPQI